MGTISRWRNLWEQRWPTLRQQTQDQGARLALIPEPLPNNVHPKTTQSSNRLREKDPILKPQATDRAQRLLRLFLERPAPRLGSLEAIDWILHLVDASDRQDLQQLVRLEISITRDEPQEDKARSALEVERVLIDSRHSSFVGASKLAPELKNWISQTVDAVVRTLKGDLSADRDLQSLESLLAVQLAGSASAQALSDVLVLVRNRLRRTVRQLRADRNLPPSRPTVEDVLEDMMQDISAELPELFWSFTQGGEIAAGSRTGEPFRREIDVVWTLREPTISAVGATFTVESEEAWRLARELLFRDQRLASALQEHSNVSLTVISALQSLSRELTFLEQDPDLEIRIAGALCRNNGILSWKVCLELANSRARFHRYVEDGDSSCLHIQFGQPLCSHENVEIFFRVLEQPLSARFQSLFDQQDVVGRVQILWQLVRFAATPQTASLSLSVAEVQHHVALRREELWRILAQ